MTTSNHGATTVPSRGELAELTRLGQRFRRHRISYEVQLERRVRFVASRKGAEVRPHTIITDDLDELRDQLEQAAGRLKAGLLARTYCAGFASPHSAVPSAGAWRAGGVRRAVHWFSGLCADGGAVRAGASAGFKVVLGMPVGLQNRVVVADLQRYGPSRRPL